MVSLQSRSPIRKGISSIILGVTLSLIGSCSPRSDRAKLSSSTEACVVVDTDATADDLRAIAMLQNKRRIVAIVTTGGGTSAGIGAAIIRRVLSDAKSSMPRILVGLQASGPSKTATDILYRDSAEHPYGPNVVFTPEVRAANLRSELLDALRPCSEVDLVVIGPWTSAVVYLTITAHIYSARTRSPRSTWAWFQGP